MRNLYEIIFQSVMNEKKWHTDFFKILRHNRSYFLWLISFSMNFQAFSQPDLSTKQIIEGNEIYRDFRRMNVYYFMPGKLRLATEADGKPKFMLIASRYTGTSVYGDAGEKKFRNILQFGISMEQTSIETLQKIKNQLGGNQISLFTMPIKNIETMVLLPSASGNEVQKIGKNGAFTSGNGEDNQGGYWKERMYSIHLENYEAELVTKILQEGKLLLSFSYAFIGNAIRGTKIIKKVSSPRQVFQSVPTESIQVIKADTVITTLPLRSETISIDVDASKWNFIRKIDINDNVPPAYSVLEARCYDFTNQLRPDLAVKVLDIEATGLNDVMVSLPSIKFLSSQPSVNTISASFPYAVKLTKPLRYRISEYKKNGERIKLDWITKENWIDIIDITTPIDSLKFQTKSIDVEATLDLFQDTEISNIEAVFYYKNEGKDNQSSVSFNKENDLLLKTVSFVADTNSQILVKITVNGTEKTFETETIGIKENYLLINPKLVGFE